MAHLFLNSPFLSTRRPHGNGTQELPSIGWETRLTCEWAGDLHWAFKFGVYD